MMACTRCFPLLLFVRFIHSTRVQLKFDPAAAGNETEWARAHTPTYHCIQIADWPSAFSNFIVSFFSSSLWHRHRPRLIHTTKQVLFDAFFRFVFLLRRFALIALRSSKLHRNRWVCDLSFVRFLTIFSVFSFFFLFFSFRFGCFIMSSILNSIYYYYFVSSQRSGVFRDISCARALHRAGHISWLCTPIEWCTSQYGIRSLTIKRKKRRVAVRAWRASKCTRIASTIFFLSV